MIAAVAQLICTGAAAAAVIVWMLLSRRLWENSGGRGRGRVVPERNVTLLLAAGVGLLAVRATMIALLATASAAFVSDRVCGFVLSGVLSGLAVVSILLRWPSAAALAGGAALAAAAELVFTLVVGAPVSPWAAAAIVAAVAVGTAAWTIARLKLGRRPLAATVACGVVAVIALGLVGWGGVVGPTALRGEGFQTHGHGGVPGAAAAGGSDRPDATEPVPLETAIEPGAPRVKVHLRAQQQVVALESGEGIEAWTYGALGGPAVVATVGDVLDLRLDNVDIANGVTAHWHGYPVPWGADGVAGVTQDAVAPGESFRTAFALDRPGTYWYHTHQLGSEGVVRGLYGTLVVLPEDGAVADLDLVLPLHTFGRTVVLGADAGAQHVRALEGWTVRARLVNTDQQPQQFTVSGAVFRVVAIDGADVQTDPLDRVGLRIPAGGRYDIEFAMPDSPVVVRAEASATTAIVFAASAGDTPPVARSTRTFDPLTEVTGSTPPDDAAAARIADAAASDRFDVDETYVLDRLPRLLHGVPQYAYTVNGAVYPYIPSTMVRDGDIVRLTVVNRSFETHPMHPHGHTVRVLAVDGIPPAAPLWLDTFDVAPGQVWEVAFVADNPGVWMDHCHNLEHAALGMVLHIAYRGQSTPFEPGGEAGNAPE
jgi:FtsP/CotA-like multicopper oxidase with cupredoxin domain